jgi:hypothetical protein
MQSVEGCAAALRLKIEGWKGGRMEGWKIGIDRGRLTMASRWLTGDRAWVKSRSAFMVDDPPFVDLVDADNLTRLVKLCAYGVN